MTRVKQTAGNGKVARIGQGKPGPGRPKGSVNRATAEAREAFSHLVTWSAPKLQGWLKAVARDDPARALELFGRLAEFVIPRLARTTLGGDPDNPLLAPITHVEIVPVRASLTDAELAAIVSGGGAAGDG